MSGLAIEAHGLTKSYGSVTAVNGIDLAVMPGEICGLLGPNGAGKTTTILMLLGLTEPTAGRISVLGFDPLRDPLTVKRHVGYLPDSVGFYDNLTARENLRYTAKLAGIPRGDIEDRIATALARVRLTDVADRKVAGYSRGMRQRLGLAEVVMKQAQIAILDEPTSGLDPQATFEFLDMIRDLKKDGVAVLLSSHLLERVQVICDRVLLFHQGRIVLSGTVSELARQVLGGGYVIHVETNATDAQSRLKRIPGVREVDAKGDGRLRLLADSDLRADVARELVTNGANLHQLTVVEPSLDDIYNRYFATADAAA